MNEQAQIAAWAAAHPQVSAFLGLLSLVVVVTLTCLAQLTLTPEQAHANPRLASAVVLAQKLGPVIRGALKPFLGIFLPKIAIEVVNAFFQSKDAPPSSRGGGAP